MKKDGWKSVINTDISTEVIKQCKEKWPDSDYRQMDVRKMSFKDGSVPVVFGKGVVDAILCAENHDDDLKDMFKEIERILAPDGMYIEICISDREIHFMKKVKFT
eukprot:UN10724